MRVPRIYQASRLRSGDIIGLHAQASHHLKNVLRLKEEATLTVFNGHGGEFSARIIAIEKSKVLVKLGEFLNTNVESPLQITLLHGIAKGDRMDWVMQKAVELGVNTIMPVITERCNVKLNKERWQKKQQHWQAIVNYACEQSGRNIIPLVAMPLNLSDALMIKNDNTKLVLYHRAEKKLSRWLATYQPQKVNLLIGSEGGLSEHEIMLAQQYYYQPVQLGQRVMRTETASMAALACLQLSCGDF